MITRSAAPFLNSVAASWLMADPAITNGSLREHRDIVLVDQRGTGGSNGLTCDFYGPPADPANYFEPFLPLSRVRECRDRLSAAADLTQYTTANSVADLDDVRAAFGYERINLDGGSYGTRPAQLYLRRYPESVRSVVLTGTPALDSHNPLDHARAGHAQFDLPGFIAEQLRQAGATRIEDLGACTYADPERFFSYRRATHRGEADYGRHLHAIALSS